MDAPTQQGSAAGLTVAQAADMLRAQREAPETPETPEVETEGLLADGEPDGEPETEIESEGSEEIEAEASEEGSTEQDAPEADDEPESYTVEQLAEAMEMDLDNALDSIKITRKVDGKTEQITLREAIEGNQRDADYRRKTQELSEQRKHFESEAAEYQKLQHQKLTEAAAVTDWMAQQLQAEYQSIPWNELRENDPAEWTAKQQEYAQRFQQFESVKRQARAQLSQYQQAQQAQHNERLRAKVAEESQKLTEVLPEWKDEKVASQERESIAKYLSDLGFNQDELNQVYDHRLILLARDGMAYRNLKAGKPEVEKKVKKLPKFVKPGTKRQVDPKLSKLKEARQRLKSSGSVEAAAELLKLSRGN